MKIPIFKYMISIYFLCFGNQVIKKPTNWFFSHVLVSYILLARSCYGYHENVNIEMNNMFLSTYKNVSQ